MTKILGKIVAKAGIGRATNWNLIHDIDPDAALTFHKLRHTFVSALISAGLVEG